MVTPYTASDASANTTRMPALTSATTGSKTGLPLKNVWPNQTFSGRRKLRPHGTTAMVVSAGKRPIIGASV